MNCVAALPLKCLRMLCSRRHQTHRRLRESCACSPCPAMSWQSVLQEILIEIQTPPKAPLYMLLEDLQDPGNVGTILRAGEGAGIDGVIMTRQTADLFNPKVIRATMGSIYRVPFFIVDALTDTIDLLREKGVAVYAAHLDDSVDYDVPDYTQPTAFLIGNEGNGLRRETAQRAAQYIKIPMAGQVESLNAAMASAVLMYEAARQRRTKTKI